MSKLAQALALAAQAAQQAPDMTEAQKGGGGGTRLLPVGKSLGRLVEYIEFGSQSQEFGGVAKDPALEVQLGFALYSPGYANEDGTPYVIRPYPFAVSRNEKARAFLLFKSLNWKGDKTHFAQLLGEAFIVDIVHAPKSKADPTLVSRVNLQGFLPPLDPLSKAPYPVPEARDEDIRLFLWDFPDKAAWDDLKIEGTFDDGRSKNFVQEKMLGAKDFAGSALEQMLLGAGVALPAAPSAIADPMPTSAPVAAPAAPVAPTAPAVGGLPVSAPFVAPAVPAAPIGQVPVAPPVVGSTVPSASTVTTSPSSIAVPSFAVPSLPAVPALPK